ncbi:MAG: hypothetical protein ACP5E4_01545, partial [Candidatus Aenigmatarchaeota archaeon]
LHLPYNAKGAPKPAPEEAPKVAPAEDSISPYENLPEEPTKAEGEAKEGAGKEESKRGEGGKAEKPPENDGKNPILGF